MAYVFIEVDKGLGSSHSGTTNRSDYSITSETTTDPTSSHVTSSHSGTSTTTTSGHTGSSSAHITSNSNSGTSTTSGSHSGRSTTTASGHTGSSSTSTTGRTSSTTSQLTDLQNEYDEEAMRIYQQAISESGNYETSANYNTTQLELKQVNYWPYILGGVAAVSLIYLVSRKGKNKK